MFRVLNEFIVNRAEPRYFQPKAEKMLVKGRKDPDPSSSKKKRDHPVSLVNWNLGPGEKFLRARDAPRRDHIPEEVWEKMYSNSRHSHPVNANEYLVWHATDNQN